MTRERKVWTPEEDAVLLRCVNESPENYAQAFRKCSQELENRTFTQCQAHWYNGLSQKQGISIMSVGRRKAVNNRKVVRQGCPVQPTTHRVSTWRKILTLLGIK